MIAGSVDVSVGAGEGSGEDLQRVETRGKAVGTQERMTDGLSERAGANENDLIA